MSKWKTITLGDVLTDDGLSYGIVQPGQPDASGVPIVRVADLEGDAIRTACPLRVAPEVEAAYTRTRLRGGEILISIVGTVGRVAMVPDSLAGWNVARAVAVLRPRDPDETSWICQALRDPGVQEQMSIRKTDTVQATLNLRDLRVLQIPWPESNQRRRIASVLGAFDDLIEVNRRIAKAAVEISRDLFNQIAACSEDSVALRDVTKKIGSGATPRGGKEVYQDEGVSFIRSQNVYDGEFSFDGLARISEAAAAALNGVTVRAGDVLINITGESVARTALVPDDALPARVSQHVAIVRADPDVLDPGFLMMALLSSPTKARLNGMSAAGATRRALTKAHLGATRIPFPALPKQRRTSRILGIIDKLRVEIADLTRTRDELLPLLMSGRVRVADAKEMVVDAGAD